MVVFILTTLLVTLPCPVVTTNFCFFFFSVEAMFYARSESVGTPSIMASVLSPVNWASRFLLDCSYGPP
jgi:hypothetical protein